MKNRKCFRTAVCLLVFFLLWTAAIRLVDARAIGPNGSIVGLAGLNHFVHDLTGVHMDLYTVTDWLGLVPLAFVFLFALLGLRQWIGRKHILKVDFSLLVLGGFYIAVLLLFILFEFLAVNFRPVLIDGLLEASYPSSTTMLVIFVMPTAGMQLRLRIRHNLLGRFMVFSMNAFTVFMVIARLISGVHWVTDIIGGVFLSAGLMQLYCGICGRDL